MKLEVAHFLVVYHKETLESGLEAPLTRKLLTDGHALAKPIEHLEDVDDDVSSQCVWLWQWHLDIHRNIRRYPHR